MGRSLESVLAHQRFKQADPFGVSPAGGSPYAGCADRTVLPEVLHDQFVAGIIICDQFGGGWVRLLIVVIIMAVLVVIRYTHVESLDFP